MVDQIISEIPDAAVMYLINALTFEAQWKTIYRNDQIGDANFIKEDGTIQNISWMYSTESWFLSDENASGLIKYYADGKYAFAALVPDEGIRMADYVASLTGERLHSILSGAEQAQVIAAIPKFFCQYDTELTDALKGMGMTDRFDPAQADLTPGIGTSQTGPLYVNQVLHKTFLTVDEAGTKAGAATAVAVSDRGTMPDYRAYLNRPFDYMLIDCQANVPIFIGALMDADT